MKTVTLKSEAEDGTPLTATYAPELGMNMVSYKRGDLEVMDQGTKPEFEKRFAGLGALIGPHFFRRNPKTIKIVPDESRFPHIKYAKEKGDPDPFTHGIGRYAPWTYEATDNSIEAILKGSDVWNGVPLSDLEGQNFTMRFKSTLTSKGLDLSLSVVSEIDSIVGTHYYYHLPKGTGRVYSRVQSQYYDPHKLQDIPKEWFTEGHLMCFDLNNSCDYAFHPYPNPREADITLDAIDFRLHVTYSCASQENGWQLYHPEGASFVCIEPCSAQDPRHANLTVSSLQIRIAIEPPK